VKPGAVTALLLLGTIFGASIVGNAWGMTLIYQRSGILLLGIVGVFQVLALIALLVVLFCEALEGDAA